MYPLSPVKANVGRLCEKLKNAMKSGLEQSCNGNFAGYFSSADKWGVTENREMYVYKSVAESRVTNAHRIINSALTGSRSPAGPRRLGIATRISASLFHRLSAFFGSTPAQNPKAAKFAVLSPGHTGFPKRAERSEGSDTTPIRNAPCFAVWAVVCDPLSKAECVPTFTRESERGAFV